MSTHQVTYDRCGIDDVKEEGIYEVDGVIDDEGSLIEVHE